MAAPDLTAAQVMNISASLLNDPNRTTYTYAVQIPYLTMALQELQEHYELHNIPVTQPTSSVIEMDAGDTTIVYNGVGVPSLPDNMVEPAQLWESPRDQNTWILMTKRDYLPHYLEGVETPYFGFYTWNEQQIEVLPANADNDIKIDYIKELFSDIDDLDENTQINVINARTFLEYRTAGLVAEFIERNLTSANALNAYAILGSGRATGIGVKGKQNIFSRRRPFRAGWKRRGWTT